MGEQPTTLEVIITSFFLVQHWDGNGMQTLAVAPTREQAQSARDALARERRTSFLLWGDLIVVEVPMVSDAASIAALVQSHIVEGSEEWLAEQDAAEAAEQAKREARNRRAQGLPVNEQGFGWWPQ